MSGARGAAVWPSPSSCLLAPLPQPPTGSRGRSRERLPLARASERARPAARSSAAASAPSTAARGLAAGPCSAPPTLHRIALSLSSAKTEKKSLSAHGALQQRGRVCISLITRIRITYIYSQHHWASTKRYCRRERRAHSKNHTTDHCNGGIFCRSTGSNGWQAVSDTGRRTHTCSLTGGAPDRARR